MNTLNHGEPTLQCDDHVTCAMLKKYGLSLPLRADSSGLDREASLAWAGDTFFEKCQSENLY